MAFAAGNFQRVRNQQASVRGLVAKILDINVFAYPRRIKGLPEAARPYCAEDEAFPADLIIRTGGWTRKVVSEDTMFFKMPNLVTGTSGGPRFAVADFDEVDATRGWLELERIC